MKKLLFFICLISIIVFVRNKEINEIIAYYSVENE